MPRLLLACAFLVSLYFNLRTTRDPVEVVRLEVLGDRTKPTLRLDFSVPMAGAGEVSLEPHAPIQARLVTPRRLVIRPEEPLLPFRTYRVHFGDAFAAADGRPLSGDAPTFDTGRFGLKKPPTTSLDWADHVRCQLCFTGPAGRKRVAASVRLQDRGGEPIPFELDGAKEEWTLELERLPEPGAVLLVGGERHELKWPFALRLVETTAGDRRIRLRFSHWLADRDASAFVRVDPAPGNLRIERDGNDLDLLGDFVASTFVSVKVLRGLETRSGLRLEHDTERRVRIPEPEPKLRFSRRGRHLSTAAVPELEMTGAGVGRVEVTIRRVFENNLVPLALGWTRADRLAAPARVETLRTGRGRWTRALSLCDRPHGVYDVTIRAAKHRWVRDRRLVQVSDLAPVVRMRREGLVVMVARLSDGKTVAGAEVVAYSAANQVVARGVTGADGLFRAPGTAAVVTASHGGDLAYVASRSHALAHDARDIEGRATPKGMDAFLYTDRGVLRPGETLRAGAILRPAPGEGFPVTLELVGPDQRTVRTLKRRASGSGWVDLALRFARDARTGPYRLSVHTPGGADAVGSAHFRVEDFVPDRIEPALALSGAGLEITVLATAKLFNGVPVHDLEAHLKVRCVPVALPLREGYTFGNPAELPEPFDLPARRLELGKAHKLELPARPLRALLELEVVDVSGRASFATASWKAAPPGPHLGIAPPCGEGLAFAVAVVGGEAPADIVATLERVEWRGGYVMERGQPAWRSRRVATLLETVKVQDGVARFGDHREGSLRVTVRAPGCAEAVLPLGRAGGAPRLALVHRGGGEIEVDAPFAGAGLLTVEGDGVFEARRVDVRKGLQRFRIDVAKTPAPNLHATLTVVRSARGAPARVLGAVAIPVPHPERELAVALSAPERALPGSTLEVTLRTSRPADAIVHVVDEGVLRLTRHSTPDPAAHFGATRRLDTRLFDAYTRIVRRMRFSGDDPEPGGGAGEKVAVRLDPISARTIESVALASRRLRVDGERKVRFVLPEFEGRLRVFAVAADATGAGAAERPLVVEAPISVAIHVPRAVAPGDEFTVPVEIRGAFVRRKVEVEGLELLSQEGGLRVRASARPGLATVTVTASDDDGNITRRSARLKVRPPAPFTVRHVVRTLDEGETIDEAVPGKWMEGTRRARLRSGPIGLEQLPALERLLEYPHGCVEQTTSRAYPALAWSSILPYGGGLDGRVRAAVDRLFAMQTSSGGLAAWPGGLEPYLFGSVYAADFLLAARKLDHFVPGEPLEALLDYLESAAGAYAALVLTRAGRKTGPLLDRLAERARDTEDRAWLAAAFLIRGDGARASKLLGDAGDPWAAPRLLGGKLSSPVRSAATLLSALLEVAPDDPRVPQLALRLRSAARGTTQDSAAALLALARLPRAAGPVEELEVGARFRFRAKRRTTLVLRVEGVPLEAPPGELARGMSVRRRIEEPGPLRQGRVYRVVIEGVVDGDASNLLVTDLLPGGLEIEEARGQEGTLEPDRVEPRDDRVLFFRSEPIGGRFRQTYLVRAVTVGRFRVPPVEAELLYDPEVRARASGGGWIEITRR